MCAHAPQDVTELLAELAGKGSAVQEERRAAVLRLLLRGRQGHRQREEEEGVGQEEEGVRKVLLVGLHACGGLTDAILALARGLNVAFLVCPCCFVKHPHLRLRAHEAAPPPPPPPPPPSASSHARDQRREDEEPPRVRAEVQAEGSGGSEEKGKEKCEEKKRCEWCGKLHGGRCHKLKRCDARVEEALYAYACMLYRYEICLYVVSI
jgi:hypothetical protein